jgi:GT2 family glycosyltransferase
MISVVLAVRNNRAAVTNCLSSILQTFNSLGLPEVEYVFVDDASDPQQGIGGLFAEFRAQLPATARFIGMQFTQQQHYTRGLAYAFSAAKGKEILFVSHDMLLTVAYVRTLLAVAALDQSIGLVRGCSPYVDCFPQHQVAPPFNIRTYDDLNSFAEFVSRYWGLNWVEDRLLTGDSMLIKREAIDKIGVFDPRYFGYFGDIDFGLRLQRAGMKLVCAKGAWLWHEGAGAYKDQAAQEGKDVREIHARRMEVVNAAYRLFRDKWDPNLPPNYPGTDALDLERLRLLPPSTADAAIPPVQPDPAFVRML